MAEEKERPPQCGRCRRFVKASDAVWVPHAVTYVLEPYCDREQCWVQASDLAGRVEPYKPPENPFSIR